MRKLISLSALQIVACLVGAAAGLIPVIEWTRPFWGLSEYRWSGLTGEIDAIRVYHLDSPAARAGFLEGDTVLRMGPGFDEFQAKIMPGEEVVFRVKRRGGEIDLKGRGEQPRLGALYYPTVWYPMLGVICLGAGALIFAARRRRWLWRPVVVMIVGLGLVLGFYFAGELVEETQRRSFLSVEGFDAANRLPWILYDLQYHCGGQVWKFEQSRVGMAASLTLAMLASVELCRIIWSRIKTTQNKKIQRG